MNILILGDSWGVPNYYGPPGVDAKYHTEFLLKDLGYTVYNCANNGGSNLASISSAKNHLISKIDWIIWFHTESLRDRNLFDADKSFLINDVIESNSRIIYQEFDKLKKFTSAKTLVIGGQAKLLDCFYEITSADFVIPDWRSSIFGKQFPTVHTLCHLDLIEKSADSLEFKNRLLKDHKTILDQMKWSEDFPDNCHPGIRPHRELVEKFSALIV